MKRKNIFCVMLMLSMIVSLVACSGGKAKGDDNAPAQSVQPSVISEDGQWLGNGGCFKLDRLSEGNYDRMKGSPEHLIFSSFDCLCSIDGSILYDGYVRDYVVTEDGIWCILEKGMVNGEYSQDCYALKLSFDGQELIRFDISDRADSFAVVSDTMYIYDAMNQKLAVYSNNGNLLGNVDLNGALLEEFSARLYIGGDGSVWLLSQAEAGKCLYPVNTSSMSLGSSSALPEDMVSLSVGTPEHPFLLTTEKELCYLDPTSGTTTNILYWDECGMFSGELRNFIPDGDGFLCLAMTGPVRLRPAQPEEIHQRTRLTLGTIFQYDGSQELAAYFNTISNDYYVDIIDYSDGGELSREDAQMKLNTEVISGSGPDMITVSDMESLQNASVFTDIYPLIDSDPELDREDFYGLNAMETGGKLLLAPSSLMISTFGALPEVVGDRTGWTWDEYFDMESKLPAGGVMSSYLGGDFFLQSSLDLYAPHAIDWVNGTCSFDTPEFVHILEAAKKGYDPNCPEENPYYLNEVNAMMNDGRMILEGASFFDVQSFAENDVLNGRELSYIGWPTPDGSCGSVFHVSGISISATAKNMDGCWEFIKYVMKSTYAYKPTFNEAIEDATIPKDATDGKQAVTLTQSQADRYRKLMENITVAVTDSSELSSIVLEEASSMFAGDKSPEETAKLIQNRLSIYVAERK